MHERSQTLARGGRLYYCIAVTEFQNKVVVITGGSGGLGRSLASAFAHAGSAVCICGRDQARLAEAQQVIASAGNNVLVLPCDVTDRVQVAALAREVERQLGNAQILINNAGIARAMSFLATPDDFWDQTIQTNLTGAYNCTKAFLPAMVRAGWGRIINVASTTAKVGYSHVTAYTASKHGLLGLTRALALEVAAKGVTVNAICPGYVNDERTHDNARQLAEKTGQSIDEALQLFAGSAPQNRLIDATEVASLALLIASAAMNGVTGQAINVDGGAVMA